MATPSPTESTIDFRQGLSKGLEMFDIIEDPRSGNATRHPFGSILFIALCAILCGIDIPRLPSSSDPSHWLYQEAPAESKVLAASEKNLEASLAGWRVVRLGPNELTQTYMERLRDVLAPQSKSDTNQPVL